MTDKNSLAHRVHEACHEALQACPQFHAYDDDQQFLVGGRTLTFGDIPNKGLAAVVGFWTNPDTPGYELLFELGYDDALPAEVAAVFKRYKALVGNALSSLESEFA